ncbi:MAG: FAD-dependent oxidoreductase, partial [Eubacteriales bacterium]
MIRIRDISLPYQADMGAVLEQTAKILRVKTLEIGALKVCKKSIDARKKPNIQVIYTIDVTVHQDEVKLLKRLRNPKLSIAKESTYAPPTDSNLTTRPVIVGFGPAGMFAGLVLAEAGLKPLILERGYDVDTRKAMVDDFWQNRNLNPHCNVQFGEGGAGTFSDGKLNTGVKNPRIGWILKRFVEFGAKEDILWDAKPHVGTDVLMDVVKNLRNHIIALGAEVKFGCQMSEIHHENSQITGISYIKDGKNHEISCDNLILATGHSARDTFQALHDQGVPMEAKPFSMGVRIEHLQKDLDTAQYGKQTAQLPPADYKLAVHLDDDQSAYTFCMCPGGYVVASA